MWNSELDHFLFKHLSLTFKYSAVVTCCAGSATEEI